MVDAFMIWKIILDKNLHVSHSHLEIAKWLAIVAMTIDHCGKIIFIDAYTITNAVGRLAYPLFAWIIGVRLALSPKLTSSYLKNMGFWAVLSQPFFVYAGNDWRKPNIFFTLLLGVAAFYGIQMFRNGHKVKGGVLILATILISIHVDYSLFGVAIIPAIAMISVRSVGCGALLIGPLGVLGNLMFEPPFLGPGAFFSIVSSVIALFALRFPVTFPRMPKMLFYAYYPGHLAVLRLLAP